MPNASYRSLSMLSKVGSAPLPRSSARRQRETVHLHGCQRRNPECTGTCAHIYHQSYHHVAHVHGDLIAFFFYNGNLRYIWSCSLECERCWRPPSVDCRHGVQKWHDVGQSEICCQQGNCDTPCDSLSCTSSCAIFYHFARFCIG